MSDHGTGPTGCVAVFVVTDIDASIDYYRDAMGFDVAFTYGEPTYFAGVCRGEVTLYLQLMSQTPRPPGGSWLCIFVGDVDAMHRELVESGAEILKEPASYPYGMREFNVEDPDGNTIIYGSPAEAHA
ncbi:MAG: VOC family protein [Deltaproteobacteria bacterium]|nr:VOC family protein [Deltaproteobacteria bacterium]MBW2385861.1 VOC family protein [Deltaproteobacteria bacterium]MBW2697746.1 VOC family protein [Deltaproteobacteria bacterium]